MKNEAAEPFSEPKERDWAQLHAQAITQLESSMFQLCKARISMLEALDQQQIRDVPADAFLGVLKRLQDCLLQRHTLHTGATDTPQAPEQNEVALTLLTLLAQEPASQKFPPYRKQLTHYVEEKAAILQQESSPVSFTPLQAPEEIPWLKPPLSPRSATEELQDARLEKQETYTWFSADEPFLASPPTLPSTSTDPYFQPGKADLTLESSKTPLRRLPPLAPPEPLPFSRVSPATVPAATAATPQPWIAPSLRPNKRPRLPSSSSSNPFASPRDRGRQVAEGSAYRPSSFFSSSPPEPSHKPRSTATGR